jgi:hypothetical protein
MKKKFLPVILLATLSVAGCATNKTRQAATPPPLAESTAIVTPDLSLAAKVVSVNAVGRFVVLNFPSGQLPKSETAVFLYRGGMKVAEVKITGPQDGNNTVGDIISGDAVTGDNVRDQ